MIIKQKKFFIFFIVFFLVLTFSSCSSLPQKIKNESPSTCYYFRTTVSSSSSNDFINWETFIWENLIPIINKSLAKYNSRIELMPGYGQQVIIKNTDMLTYHYRSQMKGTSADKRVVSAGVEQVFGKYRVLIVFKKGRYDIDVIELNGDTMNETKLNLQEYCNHNF